MKHFSLLTSILLTLTTSSAFAVTCPEADSDTQSYILRDNNRCEGLLDRQDSSGSSLSLISFVTSDLSTLPNTLNIRVAGTTNPTFQLQEFSSNYRLDSLEMQPSGEDAIFSLNSRVLKKAGITDTNSLRAIAYVADSSAVYYPTILGKASGSYTFVLYTRCLSRCYLVRR